MKNIQITKGSSKNGFGTIDDGRGKTYEGELVDGLPNGKGIELWGNVAGVGAPQYRLEGYFKEGKLHGKGKILRGGDERDKDEGNFVNGRLHGKGITTSSMSFGEDETKTFRYEGGHKNGVPHGKGIMTHPHANHPAEKFIRYEGDYKNGKRHGKGIMTYHDPEHYSKWYEDNQCYPEWREDELLLRQEGEKYEGDFKSGLKDGKGIMTYPNGEKYEGQFKSGLRDGYGTITDSKGLKTKMEFRKGNRVYRNKMKEEMSYDKLVHDMKTDIQKFFRSMLLNYEEEVHNSVFSEYSENEDGYPEEWIQKLKDEWDEIFKDSVYSMRVYGRFIQ